MPFPKKNKLYKQCENCQEFFQVRPWRKEIARFCCNECKYNFIRNKMKKNHSKKQRYKIKKICQNIHCGKVFYVVPSRSYRKYCCRKCWVVTYKKEYVEEIQEIQEVKDRKEEIRRLLSLNF